MTVSVFAAAERTLTMAPRSRPLCAADAGAAFYAKILPFGQAVRGRRNLDRDWPINVTPSRSSRAATSSSLRCSRRTSSRSRCSVAERRDCSPWRMATMVAVLRSSAESARDQWIIGFFRSGRELARASARHVRERLGGTRHGCPLLRQLVTRFPAELVGRGDIGARARLAEERLLLDDPGMYLGAGRAAGDLPADVVRCQRPDEEADGEGEEQRLPGLPPRFGGFE